MEILNKFKNRYDDKQPEELTIQEYLRLCKEDPSAYASAPERMLVAIGPSKVVNTSKDERLSRIFSNRKIKTYATFKDFYGMEQTIENVVSYFRHAAQGLEEAKQILYLLGPVGSAKSSLAERLKALFEKVPFYTIKAYNSETKKYEISPLYESPLWLFDEEEDGEELQNGYGIAPRYFSAIMSPWATKRLREFEGDISQFKVVKLWPSRLKQVGVRRQNQATRTIKTSPRLLVRSVSESSTSTSRMIQMHIHILVVLTFQLRAYLSLSKCSKHQSKCCILF